MQRSLTRACIDPSPVRTETPSSLVASGMTPSSSQETGRLIGTGFLKCVWRKRIEWRRPPGIERRRRARVSCFIN